MSFREIYPGNKKSKSTLIFGSAVAMESIVDILIIGALAVSFCFWFFWKKIFNLPPGPLGLPIVGYAPFLGKHPFVTLANLGKTYGGVFTVPMGLKSVLILNDWTAIKETLVEKADVFAGRPSNVLFKAMFDHSDIALSSGKEWKERRRFTLQHLRDFGFGKKSMEDIIMLEVEKILERLRLNPVADIGGYFYFSFMNIIWRLVGDKEFDHDDKYMLKFHQVMKVLFKELGNSNIVTFLPLLRFVPGIPFYSAIEANDRLNKFLDDEIDEHIKTYQKDYQRDFMDVYLREIFKYEEMNLKTASFTRKNLRGVMHNLFNAGIDTGSNTLSWALLYMITWPEIQQKVQEELDAVIGHERLPKYSDKAFLPYTEAVMLEVQRYATIVPLSLPHSTTSATTVRNYPIPQDTYVLENIWAVHHDPKLWGDPEVFRPERFLNSKGEVHKPEYLIPFSVGSRFCLGEPLARMEMFLFFSSLLHKFSFSKLIGVPPPTFDPVVGITLSPLPFSLMAKPRP